MFFPSFGGRSIPPAPSGAKPNSGQAQSGASDITGRFDPTALERGARALKELDASPNAARAFELTKMQELTRQKEIACEMEQLQTARSQSQVERARIEGEERRKAASHAQEQERITSQYKAQLETEAYRQKLQDQQKQNERWLAQQHQQFLRQEEMRKETEKEIMQMRRAQLAEEKALERDIIQARVREETLGRIKQERENADLHLKTLRARAVEERITRVEVIRTTLSSVGRALHELVTDRAKLTAAVAGVSALALGVYSARVGTQVFGRFIEARLGKPPLIRETSAWGLRRADLSPSRLLRPGLWWLWLRGRAPSIQEKLVLPAELSQRLQWTTNCLLTARKNQVPFRNLLLHGDPGTGKTLFARTLARESGMDYAIMSGGDVGPLGRSAAAELNKLFRWAERRSRKGLILFVDEAEAFLRRGRGASTEGTLSEDARNALSTFLSHTGSESRKLCVVLATNVREILDRAIMDRIDEEFEFPKPGLDERKRMLRMFLQQYLLAPARRGGPAKATQIAPDVNDAFLDHIAERTGGLSGRQLVKVRLLTVDHKLSLSQQLVLAMQSAVVGSGARLLTRGLAETVLNWKLAHLDQDSDTIRQQQAATLRLKGQKH